MSSGNRTTPLDTRSCSLNPAKGQRSHQNQLCFPNWVWWFLHRTHQVLNGSSNPKNSCCSTCQLLLLMLTNSGPSNYFFFIIIFFYYNIYYQGCPNLILESDISIRFYWPASKISDIFLSIETLCLYKTFLQLQLAWLAQLKQPCLYGISRDRRC